MSHITSEIWYYTSKIIKIKKINFSHHSLYSLLLIYPFILNKLHD